MTTQDYNTPFRYWMKSKMFMRKKEEKLLSIGKFLAKVAFIYNGSFLSCHTTVYVLWYKHCYMSTFMYTFEVHIVMNNVSLTSFPKKVINLIPLYCINCAHYRALYSIYEYISSKIIRYIWFIQRWKRKWKDNILVFSCFQFSCVLIYTSKTEIPNIQLLSEKLNTNLADYIVIFLHQWKQ